MDGASYNYANENYYAITEYSSVTNSSILQFSFKATGNATYIFIPWTTTSSINQTYVMTSIIIDDLGSSGVSQSDINNSLNNQTNIINNSITASTNTITENDNNNRDLIIDSQEQTRDTIIQNDTENTDRLIEENKKTFNDCRNSVNLVESFYTSSSLQQFNAVLFVKANLEPNTTYTISFNGTNGNQIYPNEYLFDGSRFTVSSNRTIVTVTTKSSISTNNNSQYNSSNGWIIFKNFTGGVSTANVFNELQIEKGSVFTDYESYGEEVCTNVLKEQEKTSKGILGKLGELITNLFSNDGPDTEQFEDMAGWLPPGPIDSILTLPLTLLNSMNNALGGTCVTFTAPIPFVNNNFTFPCFSSLISQIEGGNTLWSWVGAIASVLILYKYLIALYEWVDNVLMLRYNLHEDLGGNSANFGGV